MSESESENERRETRALDIVNRHFAELISDLRGIDPTGERYGVHWDHDDPAQVAQADQMKAGHATIVSEVAAWGSELCCAIHLIDRAVSVRDRLYTIHALMGMSVSPASLCADCFQRFLVGIHIEMEVTID